MSLLIASSNPGKLQEFAALLQPLAVVTPAELGLSVHIEETGETFAANALLKARAFAAASGLIALADDSGLEVDALGNAPGVLSARFGGPGLTDAQRCELLLERLAALPSGTGRQARFRCCVTAAAPDGRTCAATGTLEGSITTQMRGTGGFGYDSVFLVPSLGQTVAQIPAERKNRLSHRARALRRIGPLLARAFPELAPQGTIGERRRD
jgi:XTP/dITP diphosphohydrolase